MCVCSWGEGLPMYYDQKLLNSNYWVVKFPGYGIQRNVQVLCFVLQLTVYNYEGGPCYRCLYPTPPPPETVTNCSDGGVLGAGNFGSFFVDNNFGHLVDVFHFFQFLV